MYCLRVNVTSPRQILMHILMSLANKPPFILVSLYYASEIQVDQTLGPTSLYMYVIIGLYVVSLVRAHSDDTRS